MVASRINLNDSRRLAECNPQEHKTFGNHIWKVRLDRKLPQGYVAKIINVEALSITGWEFEHTKPQVQFCP